MAGGVVARDRGQLVADEVMRRGGTPAVNQRGAVVERGGAGAGKALGAGGTALCEDAGVDVRTVQARAVVDRVVTGRVVGSGSSRHVFRDVASVSIGGVSTVDADEGG